MRNEDTGWDEDDAPEPVAAELIASVNRLWGGACRDCQVVYAGHEVVFSIAMGFKDAPRCVACLARGLSREVEELRSQLIEYVHRRDCFRQAWEYARRREQATEASSSCPADGVPTPQVMTGETESRGASMAGNLSVQAEWDAGNMGCGDLVLALRIKLNAMPPGSVLKLTARDPAGPEDLPAWCRLTGHILVQAEPPVFYIQRKET